MKTLFLLRHAKSSWDEGTIEDFDRPLARRGRAAAKALGVLLTEKSWQPAQILCSSAKRTRETLERIERHLSATVPTRFEKGLYMAEAPALLRRLRRLNDQIASVMVIGHNPGLENLAHLLAGGGPDDLRRLMTEKFPTGALAVVTAGIDHWTELKPGCGSLEAFVRPRDLKAR
jgi:phosphohistidine phosphatase